MFEYRVWPDYTIQDAEEIAIGYMSDDYVYIYIYIYGQILKKKL